MIHLNFNDLNEDAKHRILENSRKDVKQKFGEDIRKYIQEHNTSFEKTIEEEAQRNLYTYKYVFTI
ncbi:hypothetical protein DCS32_15365 [Dokdonia sp. Dokd-P16]|uniref:hypothetical protein n=1 Tax=Dokdonia sp. Dokd-P16 TaxID=2173169 RepID=UPI000D547A3D|nr:hypothetical protein [Dokdonia sp. Dokd-P16]AWH75490.1 hypothetical protein DCS32_15365 [Dokdonia sp. Dokd-P16]